MPDPTQTNAEVPDTDSEIEVVKELGSIAASEESKPEGVKDDGGKWTTYQTAPKMESEEQQKLMDKLWASVNSNVESKMRELEQDLLKRHNIKMVNEMSEVVRQIRSAKTKNDEVLRSYHEKHKELASTVQDILSRLNAVESTTEENKQKVEHLKQTLNMRVEQLSEQDNNVKNSLVNLIQKEKTDTQQKASNVYRMDLSLVLQQVELKLKENYQEVQNLREDVSKVLPLKDSSTGKGETKEATNLVNLVEQSRKRNEELTMIPPAPATPPRVPVGNGEAPPPPATAPVGATPSGNATSQQLLASLVAAAQRNATGNTPNNLAVLQNLMMNLPRPQQLQLQQLVAQQQAQRNASQQAGQKLDTSNIVASLSQQLGGQTATQDAEQAQRQQAGVQAIQFAKTQQQQQQARTQGQAAQASGNTTGLTSAMINQLQQQLSMHIQANPNMTNQGSLHAALQSIVARSQQQQQQQTQQQQAALLMQQEKAKAAAALAAVQAKFPPGLAQWLAANPTFAQKLIQQAGQGSGNTGQLTQAALMAVQQAVQQQQQQSQGQTTPASNRNYGFNQEYFNQVLGNLNKEAQPVTMQGNNSSDQIKVEETKPTTAWSANSVWGAPGGTFMGTTWGPPAPATKEDAVAMAMAKEVSPAVAAALEAESKLSKSERKAEAEMEEENLIIDGEEDMRIDEMNDMTFGDIDDGPMPPPPPGLGRQEPLRPPGLEN